MTGATIKRHTRREWLRNTSLATAAYFVPRHVLGGTGFVPPSDKINIALVGAGGRGRRNALALMKLDDCQITAVADPAEQWDLSKFYYGGVAGRLPVTAEIEAHYASKTPNFKCQQFEDYRELLEKDSAVDAVLCATPDHLHASVSIAAMRAGKHTYCEKPLTHNVAEARQLGQLARESKLATQMGNQGHSADAIRLIVEYLQAGAIGNVNEVHAWVPATRWNPGLKGKPTDRQAVPAGLNWDLWLGPRAGVSFHDAYAPVAWRDFWMFGCGAMGDFGCHDLDAACWALDLHAPDSVEMFPAGYSDQDIAPYGEIGYFHFPERNGRPPVKLTWYSGGLRPPRPAEIPNDFKLPSRGALFIGDQGILVSMGLFSPPKLMPPSRAEAFPAPQSTIPRSNGHHRDWLDAIKGGSPASSHFQYGARLTEITLLGVAALRCGKKLNWNAQDMSAPGYDPHYFHGTYRKGWEL